jgi:hypothetical protein
MGQARGGARRAHDFSSDIHSLVPLRSTFPSAMLNAEDCDHPMRMVTLSEHREPKGLHMSLMTRLRQAYGGHIRFAQCKQAE